MSITIRRPSEDDLQSHPFGRPISKESVSQQAYTAIRDSLMRSRLKPGQKLVARQVADELGISVTPVRESLLRLASEHALTIDERGTVIVPRLTRARCIEIRDLRRLLEGEGAARAAEHATEADFARLEEIHARYIETESARDYARALVENENFHFAVCRLAQAPALFRLVENLWMQFGPILSALYDGTSRPFHGREHGHIAIIEAIKGRDAKAARYAMSQDILIGGAALLERFSD